MLGGRYMNGCWPSVQEGGALEDKSSVSCLDSFKQAQTEVGTLQWLAIKTRPDNARVTSTMESMTTRTPTEVARVTGGVLEAVGFDVGCYATLQARTEGLWTWIHARCHVG